MPTSQMSSDKTTNRIILLHFGIALLLQLLYSLILREPQVLVGDFLALRHHLLRVFRLNTLFHAVALGLQFLYSDHKREAPRTL